MLDHWPSGGRDTTEFPAIDISVNPDFRDHLEGFCKLDNVGWSDYDRINQVSGFTEQRYRTFRKMYQNLGFIYPEDEKVKLSSLGRKLCQLPSVLSDSLRAENINISKMAVSILSRYQVLNPTESQKNELPGDCDVLPNICIWKAMLELDNKMHHEELNRVILRVMKMTDLDAAIRKIKTARSSYLPYLENESNLSTALGDPVHTNQPAARVAYWYSFAGWGGLLIEQSQDQAGFRHINTRMIDVILRTVQDPPMFYNAVDKVDWERYYIGNVATVGSSALSNLLTTLSSDLTSSHLKFSKNIITCFIASLCTKPFVILTGLSGSGKTKIAQALSGWITQKYKPYSLKIGDQIKAAQSTYLINDIDKLGVLLTQSGSNTKTLIPHAVISSWVKTIKIENYTDNTPSQTIQKKVLEMGTEYSPTIHGFHSPLKALAFYQINNEDKLNEINQNCLVPVGADWTNREPLLGFTNALKRGRYVNPDNGVLDFIIEAGKPENSKLPFFLILDEMNLSHVERYFADFLSAMESDEPITLHPDGNEWKNEGGSWKDGVPDKINLSNNLFIIGTVNIDETTYMFSPKVLDRANVIEFRVSDYDMNEFLQNPVKPDLDTLTGAGASMATSFLQLAHEEITDFDKQDEINETLLKFFKELKKAGAEFGYRTASEIYRFAGVLKKLTEKDSGMWSTDDIIDAVIIQKLLPKVHGSRKKLEPILGTLSRLCLATEEDEAENLLKALEKSPDEIDTSEKVRFKISLEKILRMKKRVIQDGFTSFAEA